MNYMYCEQLLREIRKALYLHPLYISGKCNALQIVLNRDDFFELQAYEMAPMELDDDDITVHYLYGVPVKISPLIHKGEWKLIERDMFAESYSGPVDALFYNCRNCGAPIELTKDKCPYCETPYHEKAGRHKIIYDCAHINLDVINVLLRSEAISPNEARKLAGFHSSNKGG